MAIPAGMRRLTVDLVLPLREQLDAAAQVDGVAPPARLRALATLWEDDPDLQRRVSELAQEQHAEARQRAVRSRLRTLAAREALAG